MVLKLNRVQLVTSKRNLAYDPLLRRHLHSPTASRKFKILFCGNDEFSSTVLDKLLAAQELWESIHVVTNKDRSTGRNGSQTRVSPVRLLAEEKKLPVSLLSSKQAFKTWSVPLPVRNRDNNLDSWRLLLTASFGHIIPHHILQHFQPTRRLNVHPSLLPQFRGPAPIQHAIADGVENTGVSIIGIQPISKGIDSGSIWAQEPMRIPANARFFDLRSDLSQLGATLVLKVMEGMITGNASSSPQPVVGSTYAPVIKAISTTVDFETWDAFRVERVHRAMGHQRPLRAFLDMAASPMLHIVDFEVRSPPLAPCNNLLRPGDSIYDRGTQSLIVRCANDTEISVTKVKQEGRRSLHVREWENGLQNRGSMVRFLSKPPKLDSPIVES